MLDSYSCYFILFLIGNLKNLNFKIKFVYGMNIFKLDNTFFEL